MQQHAPYPPQSPFWPPGNGITSQDINKAKHAVEQNHKKYMLTLTNIQNVESMEDLFSIIKVAHPPSSGTYPRQVPENIISAIIDATRRVVSEGLDVIDKPDTLGRTLLHTAVINKNVDLVNALHALGANVNTVSQFRPHDTSDIVVTGIMAKAELSGDTPLHDAVYNGHYEMIWTLIKLGADVNYLNNKNKTALDIARTVVAATQNDRVRQLGEKIIELFTRPTAAMWIPTIVIERGWPSWPSWHEIGRMEDIENLRNNTKGFNEKGLDDDNIDNIAGFLGGYQRRSHKKKTRATKSKRKIMSKTKSMTKNKSRTKTKSNTKSKRKSIKLKKRKQKVSKAKSTKG
tara:strand:+ start:1945 stop:2982 length:1038 start_codon:yes stop_codon:yes gene_type:complete